MEFVEVKFFIDPFSNQMAEILVALLAQIQFDSFAEENQVLLAYIPMPLFSLLAIESCLDGLGEKKGKISYTHRIIEPKNWNEVWESNFEPITVENFCLIRAPFHPSQAGYAVEVVIEPKMAFGTGHHQTTWLMARELFNLNLDGKSVLDMGCGTGILAIIAEKLGARPILAIDNDEWAYRNTLENTQINDCRHIQAELGDATLLKNRLFDFILANINLNILVADMESYAQSLNANGHILFSGILMGDVENLRVAAEAVGLQFLAVRNRNDWALVLFKLP